ncbi:MAG: energy transducer TonB [Candidatus Bipolaricaulia bacterium]
MRPNLGADPMPEARVGPTGPAAAESVSIRRAIPRYDLNPPPSYPEVARRRGYEGTVLLAVRVRKDGGVAAAQIAETSGYEVLDRAAVRAVRAWRFRPARRGEEPVEMEVRVPVRFQLQ